MKLLKWLVVFVVVVILLNLIFPETVDNMIDAVGDALGINVDSVQEHVDDAAAMVKENIGEADKKVGELIDK